MRKVYSVLLALAAVVVLNVSCSKDDEDKTYDKAQLIGTWEQTAGVDFVACPDGDNAKMVISDSEIKEYSTNDAGCSGTSYASYEYTFDGKKMDVMSGLVTYTIVELNATTLKINISTILGGSESATYTKQ